MAMAILTGFHCLVNVFLRLTEVLVIFPIRSNRFRVRWCVHAIHSRREYITATTKRRNTTLKGGSYPLPLDGLYARYMEILLLLI